MENDSAAQQAASTTVAKPASARLRPLIISVILAGALAACAWYYDAMMIAMLCTLALLWNGARLLYYLLRWNRKGMLLSVARVVIWCAAFAGIMTAHNHYSKLTRQRGDALVAALKTYHAREKRYPKELEELAPRDIAAIPGVALLPSRDQKFRYRMEREGERFTLMYLAGFRLASQYDSEQGKWEELD